MTITAGLPPLPEIKLPALPQPSRRRGQQMSYDGYDRAHFDCFDPAAMQEYALLAVQQERERCAAICDSYASMADEITEQSFQHCAAAIRASGGPSPVLDAEQA